MSTFQRNIQHLVVLMMENRSYDHMLGFLGAGDGLTGSEFNVPDLSQPGPKIFVSKDASYASDFLADPSHRLEDINVQVFGTAVEPDPLPAETNKGFVLNYSQRPDVTPATAGNVMKCFDPDRLPALATLAREFAVCDRWFSSLPGPTWPNRFFVHAATSMGHIDNEPRAYTARTIYDNLHQAGEDWSIYFHDIPQALTLARLRKRKFKQNFKVFGERFHRDCMTGLLPTYSFIEPRYFDFLSFKANDQHPPHDVALGDVLVAEVYESLRQSPMWDSTLLVVIWDEHGGIYDHVLPPKTLNPDNLVHINPPFDFTRLGVRVPAVLASPWIRRGTVDSTVYDHTTVPASLKELLDLPEFLTKRDAAAETFGHLITDTKRTDAPETLPRATSAVPAARTTARLETAAVVASLGERSKAPLSEFQQSLIDFTRTLPPPEDERLRVARAANVPTDEHAGAVHVREAVQIFLNE